MVDCQKYVKLLHGNGVEVRFEKENLDTADPSCSMMFSFLSTISQDESHSISENVKWAYRERFKRGEYNLGSNRVFGYDSEDGKLVPNEYADAVRRIYSLFLDGKTFTEIAAEMKAADVCGRHGAPLTVPGIIYILENEVYVGDKLLQKRAPKNFLTKPRFPDGEGALERRQSISMLLKMVLLVSRRRTMWTGLNCLRLISWSF